MHNHVNHEDTSAEHILDEAVAAAQAMGVACMGWMVQRDPSGIVAWLYAADEDGRFVSLMDDVETFPTLLQAAHWCLAVVYDHAREDDDEE
jgi:hypothetical protein